MFDDREYTIDSLIKQWSLVELHSKDGSAEEAGCQCIEAKHLFIIEGLAEEGVGFAMNEKERQFYLDLANLARLIRKKMENEEWDLHGVMRQVQKARHPIPKHVSFKSLGNPHYRKYLPHGLTACERKHKDVQIRLASCIKQIEERENCYPPYKNCRVNPVAVCRASIRCPS